MKNRQRQLFSHVPTYEKIQVHAYMYLTDIHECRMIQSFKNTESTVIIPFDENFWTEIIQRLSLVAVCMDRLVADTDMQDQLLVSNVFPVEFSAILSRNFAETHLSNCDQR